MRYKACTVENCDGNAHWSTCGCRGYCGRHYSRFRRHGDPLAGGTDFGEPARFLAKAVEYDGDECVCWPFNTNSQGYGLIWDGETSTVVSRRVCERVNGPSPSPDHEAAHSCGKGHLACITPGHLSWKTRLENRADMIGHGTVPKGERNGQAKLTEIEAREIKQMRGVATHRDLAGRFGVSASTISAIQNGVNWAWIDG